MTIHLSKKRGVTIVSFIGYIERESFSLFTDRYFESLLASNFAFDFSQCEFVGSSGVTELVKFIKKLFDAKQKTVKVFSLSDDFQAFFKLQLLDFCRFYENEEEMHIALAQEAYADSPQ